MMLKIDGEASGVCKVVLFAKVVGVSWLGCYILLVLFLATCMIR